MFNKATRTDLSNGLRNLRADIGKRLFGENGMNCLNLYNGEGVLGEFRKVSQNLRVRLFGEQGKDCLNLYDGNGILGEFRREIANLKERIEILETPKVKKKSTKKSKKAKK